MQFLSVTFAFLIIFSIFAMAQFNKLKEHVMMGSTYLQCYEKNHEALTKAFALRAYALKKRQVGTIVQDKPQQKSDTTRTRFLHIGPCITGDATIEETIKLSKELLKNLIEKTYGNKKFYQEAIKADKSTGTDFAERLLTDLFNKDKQTLITDGKIKRVADLANLSLPDTNMQKAFYKMLKGNRPANDEEESENYPSLVDLISFRERISLASVYLAPREVLEVLFEKPEVIDAILLERHEIHKRVSRDKNPEDLNTASGKFKKDFEQHLRSSIPLEKVDFGVSTTRP